jgi:hypothetical protein
LVIVERGSLIVKPESLTVILLFCTTIYPEERQLGRVRQRRDCIMHIRFWLFMGDRAAHPCLLEERLLAEAMDAAKRREQGALLVLEVWLASFLTLTTPSDDLWGSALQIIQLVDVDQPGPSARGAYFNQALLQKAEACGRSSEQLEAMRHRTYGGHRPSGSGQTHSH